MADLLGERLEPSYAADGLSTRALPSDGAGFSTSTRELGDNSGVADASAGAPTLDDALETQPATDGRMPEAQPAQGAGSADADEAALDAALTDEAAYEEVDGLQVVLAAHHDAALDSALAAEGYGASTMLLARLLTLTTHCEFDTLRSYFARVGDHATVEAAAVSLLPRLRHAHNTEQYMGLAVQCNHVMAALSGSGVLPRAATDPATPALASTLSPFSVTDGASTRGSIATSGARPPPPSRKSALSQGPSYAALTAEVETLVVSGFNASLRDEVRRVLVQAPSLRTTPDYLIQVLLKTHLSVPILLVCKEAICIAKMQGLDYYDAWQASLKLWARGSPGIDLAALFPWGPDYAVDSTPCLEPTAAASFGAPYHPHSTPYQPASFMGASAARPPPPSRVDMASSSFAASGGGAAAMFTATPGPTPGPPSGLPSSAPCGASATPSFGGFGTCGSGATSQPTGVGAGGGLGSAGLGSGDFGVGAGSNPSSGACGTGPAFNPGASGFGGAGFTCGSGGGAGSNPTSGGGGGGGPPPPPFYTSPGGGSGGAPPSGGPTHHPPPPSGPGFASSGATHPMASAHLALSSALPPSALPVTLHLAHNVMQRIQGLGWAPRLTVISQAYWFTEPVASALNAEGVRDPPHDATYLVSEVARHESMLRSRSDKHREAPHTAGAISECLQGDSSGQAGQNRNVGYAQQRGVFKARLFSSYLYFLLVEEMEDGGASESTLNLLLTAVSQVAKLSSVYGQVQSFGADGLGHSGISRTILAIDYHYLATTSKGATIEFLAKLWYPENEIFLDVFDTLSQLGRHLRKSETEIVEQIEMSLRRSRDEASSDLVKDQCHAVLNEFHSAVSRVGKTSLLLVRQELAQCPLVKRTSSSKRKADPPPRPPHAGRDAYTGDTGPNDRDDEIRKAMAQLTLQQSQQQAAALKQHQETQAQLATIAASHAINAGGSPPAGLPSAIPPGGGTGSIAGSTRGEVPPSAGDSPPFKIAHNWPLILQHAGCPPKLQGVVLNEAWNAERDDGKHALKCALCVALGKTKDMVEELTLSQFRSKYGPPSKEMRQTHFKTTGIVHDHCDCRNAILELFWHTKRNPQWSSLHSPDPEWCQKINASKAAQGITAVADRKNQRT